MAPNYPQHKLGIAEEQREYRKGFYAKMPKEEPLDIVLGLSIS